MRPWVGAATAPVGAPRGMLLAGAPLAAPEAQSAEAHDCERRDGQQDAPNAPGGWRVRNGPRRACAVGAVKR